MSCSTAYRLAVRRLEGRATIRDLIPTGATHPYLKYMHSTKAPWGEKKHSLKVAYVMSIY